MTGLNKWTALAASMIALTLAGCGAESEPTNSASAAASSDAGESANAFDADSLIKPTDMVIGDPDADVVIIEFASITCPHCATFHYGATDESGRLTVKGAYPEIKKKYADTGQVRFVFREMLTPPFDLALAGFHMARCAADARGEAAYFALVGEFFRTQPEWNRGNPTARGYLSDITTAKPKMLSIARATGITDESYTTCLSDTEAYFDSIAAFNNGSSDSVDVPEGIRATQELITANSKEARERWNVTGTPQFIVNDEKKDRLYSLEQFDEVLQPLLPSE